MSQERQRLAGLQRQVDVSLLVWQRGADHLDIESWSDVPELRGLLERGVTIIAPTHTRARQKCV